MKTRAEIEATIEFTKHSTKSLADYLGAYENGEADGWVNALTWVLDESFDFPQTEPFDWESVEPRSWEEIKQDFMDWLQSPSPIWTMLKEKDAPQETNPIEEEFPHLTRNVLEDEPKSNQV